jgi:gliding motility-associated-like protein
MNHIPQLLELTQQSLVSLYLIVMRRLIAAFIIVCISFLSKGQYADLGSGSQRDKIWWFNWAGVTVSNGSSKVFTTADGLTVTATFSSVNGPTVFPEVMNTWSGAILHLLYDFSDASIKPALYTSQNTTNSSFTLTISATRNGLPTPFTFVAADAEASIPTEITTLQSSGSNWQIIDFYRNSSQTTNPLSGCNSTYVNIMDTYGGSPATGQNPVIATNAPATGLLTVNVTLNKPTIPGAMGVAFGIFAPVDRGDLPPSYGYVYHKLNFISLNSCNYQPPLPSLVQAQSLKLGSTVADADAVQSLDDNVSGGDEDALTSFPPYNGSGTYSLVVPLTNVTGTIAYLKGWLDYTRNGVFEVSESASVMVFNNATSAILVWSGLPASFSPGSVADFGLRLRLSSNQAAIQNQTGFAEDGEVEDYLIPSTTIATLNATFSSADTICVNAPLSLINNSFGASSYYWNFCSPDVNNAPTGNLISNPGNLSSPAFIDYAYQNGNYYGFVINNDPGGLVRLDFGNSLLNTPTSTFLGTFGGAVTINGQGIHIINNNGNWIGIFAGGEIASVGPRIVKLDFGSSLTNTPVATNWGNIGGVLNYPADIYVFKENSNWYGLTVNYRGETLTRLNFGASFTGMPTATNLGNIGSLNLPNAFYPIKDNGTWRVFVANNGNNSLSRVDFGSSLLNAPTGVNLGNVGGVLNTPSDLHILNNCGQYTGYLVNAGNSTLVRLDFANLSSMPSATSLGNIGNMNAPHSISRIFRVGSDLYAFAVNLNSNSLTRFKFTGCNNSSIPSSTVQNPPSITFNSAGTYKITLVTDEGLSTQSSFCKPVVVLNSPVLSITPAASICDGDTIPLNVTGAAVYSWSPAAGLSNANVANPIAYPVATTKYMVTAYDHPGCTIKDSVMVTVNPKPVITKTNDTTLCTGGSPVSISATSPGAIQYSWTPSTGLSNAGVSNPSANPSATTNYHIEITGNNGCKSTDSINVTVFPVPTVDTRSDTTLCSGAQLTLNTVTTGASSYTWSPVTGLSNPNIANPVAIPAGLTKYILTVSNGACSAKDSVTLNVIPSPTITTSNDTTICDQGQAQLLAAGGNNYLWYPSAGLSNVNIANPVATPAAATKYYVSVTGANGCKKTDSVMVNWVAKPVFSITPPTVSICTGDSTLLSATGADTYNWFSGSGIQSPSASSTMVNPAVTQQYRVAVHHNFCRLNDTLQSTVTVNNLPLVAVSKSNDIDCSNASATLSASGGVTYNWMPAVNISAGNTANPVVSPPLSTTYVVKVTNNNGCSKYDSIRVIVAFNPITGGYNVPDAFTPNHDNKNDCFGIKYWGVVQAFELSIFNRWGEMVFHSTNPSACWDGSYQGAPQATGTFVYQIRAKTACGDVFKKGTLALIR